MTQNVDGKGRMERTVRASVIRRKTRAARGGTDTRAVSPVRALRLALAHRLSLCHAGWMARALRAGADFAPRSPAAPAGATADANLSGFLDALADAQDQDRGAV